MIRTYFMLISLFLCCLCALAQTSPWMVVPNSPLAIDRWDAMEFVHPDTGWIAGTKSGAYRTYDGGGTWHELTSAYTDINDRPYFRSMSWASAKVGWLGVLGGPNQILHTVDGGNTWTRYPLPAETKAKGICGIDAVNEQHAYFVGPFMAEVYGVPHVTSTHDGGQSYVTTLVDVHFQSIQHGIVGGGKNGSVGSGYAVVLLTQDSGRTWQTVYQSASQGTQLWKFSESADGTIAGAIQSFRSAAPYVIYSADNGRTWTESPITVVPDSTLRGLQSVGVISKDVGWVAGRGFSSWSTTNGGTVWKKDTSNLNSVNRFQFFGDTLGYASGNRVWKYRPTTTTSADPTTTTQNGSQHESLSITNAGGGHLTVHLAEYFTVRSITLYDVQGREIPIRSQQQAEGIFNINYSAAKGPAIVVVCTTIDCLSAMTMLR